MSVSFQGERLMLGTGVKADLAEWDESKQRFSVSRSPENEQLNSWLDRLDDAAHEAWEQLQKGGAEVSRDAFRKRFLQLKPRNSLGFFDVFLRFLEDGNERWAKASYQKVRTLYVRLQEFERSRRMKLTFEAMDASFIRDFESFYQEMGKAPSTTYRSINTLVWFLNWASAEGYNGKQDYRHFYKSFGQRAFTPKKSYYLQWQELMDLGQHPCGSRKQERVRDLFCFMCFTGLRYSELQRLKKGDLSETRMVIHKAGGKTREVPLNMHAGNIARRYANRYYLEQAAFPPMSPITFNKYLKNIARDAGLNREVFAHDQSPQREPLYQVITAGLAVHTFIANAISLGASPELLSVFTGTVQDVRVKRIRQELAATAFPEYPPS